MRVFFFCMHVCVFFFHMMGVLFSYAGWCVSVCMSVVLVYMCVLFCMHVVFYSFACGCVAVYMCVLFSYAVAHFFVCMSVFFRIHVSFVLSACALFVSYARTFVFIYR